MKKKILTEAQVCEWWGIDKAGLAKLRSKQHKLPYIRVTRTHFLYFEHRLLEWLETRREIIREPEETLEAPKRGGNAPKGRGNVIEQNELQASLPVVSGRSQSKANQYLKWMGSICSMPGCTSGLDIEVHHIIPLSQGGDDSYHNLITLCRDCHRTNHLHRGWGLHITELYAFKFSRELQVLGITSDRGDRKFARQAKKAKRQETSLF